MSDRNGLSRAPRDALGAFASLPPYEFDFDYRGQSLAPSSQAARIPRSPSSLVDDFDSYMFPDPDRSRPSSRAPSSSSTSHSASSSPCAPPPVIDWPAVENALLFAPDHSVIDVDKLYTGYCNFSVLIFVPRHAVELCALVYGKLAHLLLQVGARLCFITAWQPAQATLFLSRFERVSPCPAAIVCDPHAHLFSAFGFTRSPLRALFAANKVSAPMRQGMRNAFSTVSYRAQNRDIANTPVPSKRLKCGAVVMTTLRGYEKRPCVKYISEEHPSTGVGCYLDVLSACGVNDAFVPDVDVAQVYARFNNMRANSIKARHADQKEAHRINNTRVRTSRKNDLRNALKG
ncbi:unnamed protein product [Agarophyton chilense]